MADSHKVVADRTSDSVSVTLFTGTQAECEETLVLWRDHTGHGLYHTNWRVEENT